MEINEAATKVLYAYALDACYAQTCKNLHEFMGECYGDEDVPKEMAAAEFIICQRAKAKFAEFGITDVCAWIEETFPQELF